MLNARELIGTHDVLFVTLDTLRYDVARDALAAGRTRGRSRGRGLVGELLHASVNGSRPEHGGDALDRLGPLLHGVTVVNEPISRTSPLCCPHG